MDKIINHMQSDNQGSFKLNTGRNDRYKIMIVAPGLKPKLFSIENVSNTAQNNLVYVLSEPSKISSVKHYTKELLNDTFETILICTFVIEVIIGLNLGWLRVVPFLALSLLNVAIWAVHLHHLKLEINQR